MVTGTGLHGRRRQWSAMAVPLAVLTAARRTRAAARGGAARICGRLTPGAASPGTGHPRRVPPGRAGSSRGRVLLAGLLAAGVLGALTAAPSSAVTGQAAASSPGQVLAWGVNLAGQLGVPLADTQQGFRPAPGPVPGLPGAGITAAAASETHSLALTRDGRVYAWGLNSNSELGVPPQDTPGLFRSRPEPVPGLPDDITSVAAGGIHSLALTRDGRVYAWGANDSGQLGVPPADTPDRSRTAAPVPGLPDDIIAVAAGYAHSLALTRDGQLYAWGWNGNGQLGVPPADTTHITPTGPVSYRSTPEPVPGLPGIRAAAPGIVHNLALTRDGQVYAWGENTFGKLGVPPRDTPGGSRSTPEPVPGLPDDITALAAGEYHSLALTRDGQVYAWGWNRYGQLGVPPADTTHLLASYRSTPEPVPGLTGVTAISAGLRYSLALAGDGPVDAWGENNFGQLGLSPEEAGRFRSRPEPVPGLPGDITALAAGGRHGLAITPPQPQTAEPTVTTSLRPRTVTVGRPVSDTATLSGFSEPAAGTVYYARYRDQAACRHDTGAFLAGGAPPGRASAAVKVAADGTVPSSGQIPVPAAGTYWWAAFYTGNQHNRPAASGCGDEKLTVTEAPVTPPAPPLPVIPVTG